MSKKAVEKLFDSLYRLTDLRQVFRETAPDHDLDDEKRNETLDLLDEVENNLSEIRKEIKK